MSDNGQDRFEIPKDMRSMAEASFEQARKTFEKFVASAQATAGSIEERGATVRAGAKDVSSKAISFAEKNVQASLDYAQSLLKARDLPSRPAKWARLSAAPRWMRRSLRRKALGAAPVCHPVASCNLWVPGTMHASCPGHICGIAP